MYMHQHSLKLALGLSGKNANRMPADFAIPRDKAVEVEGVKVYVTLPHKGRSGGKAFGHRVRAICPECGQDFSAGHLFEHRGAKHGVKAAYRPTLIAEEIVR